MSCAHPRRFVSWNCCSCARPRGCGSCSPPATICGLACTGCGWRGSSPRCARPICASPSMTRGRCSWRPGYRCPVRRSGCCMSGPKAGRPGCGWRRCRWPGTRIRTGSRPSSPAASGRWRNTCWPRCSTASPSRSVGCCCGPRCWTGSTANWPTC